MADFAEIRDQLRLARDARDGAAADVARTVQALKRLATERTALDRRADAHGDEATGRRKALEAREKELRATLDSARERQRALDSAALDLSGRFAAFTDPRKGINRLDDDTPLLLMPLRLETRFKRSATPGAAPRDELWVRVFPDDCWIDSFDPILTEGEVASAAAYWRALWASGGDPALDRAAWTTLATGHGANRAAWIVRSYQPTNLAERPVRLDASDVFLPITLDSALAPGEATALAAFWRAVWVAAGDATAVGVATTTLELAVGAARAAELIAAHVPANLDAAPPDGVSREDVTVSVPFLLLPSVETKRETWSQAPRARILPDRFVFVGYERENDPTPVTVVGGAVASPLQVGPDPTAPESEQLRHDAEGNLIVPDELLWLTDFDRAVQVGMGMRVPLTPSQAANGFARVLVVGVRLNASADVAQQELETLLSHHRYSSSGLAILPQGTPTNNTEAQPAGYDRFDDADAAFDDAAAPLFAPASGWRDKRDGEWLAQVLGIDPSLLVNVHGAGTTDQRVMRAMHTALWPATLGYWMESMMSPVFSDEVVERTREFFTQHVIPGGAVPVVRIGAQPYGILPTTAFSRMRWFEPRPSNDRLALVVGRDPMLAWLRAFYPILRTIDDDFSSLARDVAHVGKAGDPHALLLDVVGLHPGSVDWVQRHAEHLKTLYNRLSLQGFGGKLQALITAFVRQQARARLTTLGYSGDKDPPILDLIFNRAHNQLTGGVVDAIPVSETQALRAATTDGRNYLRWLLDASSTSLDALYAQAGFTDDRPPSSLLYLFLRHALQLGYHDTGIRLHQRAGLYDATAMQRARQDDPFLHVRAGDGVSESRYQPLYERVAGDHGEPDALRARVHRGVAHDAGRCAQPHATARGPRGARARVHRAAGARLCRSHRRLFVPARRLAAGLRARAAGAHAGAVRRLGPARTPRHLPGRLRVARAARSRQAKAHPGAARRPGAGQGVHAARGNAVAARQHQPGVRARPVAQPRGGGGGAAQRLHLQRQPGQSSGAGGEPHLGTRARRAGDDRGDSRRTVARRPARLPVRAWPARPPRVGRGRQVHLQAASGLSAARRPHGVDQASRRGIDRGDRGAQRRQRPLPRRAREGDGECALSLWQGDPAAGQRHRSGGDRRRGRPVARIA
ncbi:MAG: hypothetical protein IPN16_21045 [Gemmatimonadetes bacterium]|nr:hypothetical protein [Gemmatimonadota bacterium]